MPKLNTQEMLRQLYTNYNSKDTYSQQVYKQMYTSNSCDIHFKQHINNLLKDS